MTTTTSGTAENFEAVHQDNVAVGRCECPVYDSVIPPLYVRVTTTGVAAGNVPVRKRRVDLLCPHCDTAYVLHQIRDGDGWRTRHEQQADASNRERIAQQVAGRVSAAEFGGGVDDNQDEAARAALIARLDQIIAGHEELARVAREQRSELIGVTPAETAALPGKAGGGRFPFVSGDMRQLMGDGFDGLDAPWAHG